ncbi:IMP cyclohydrolase [Longilinea arvoryzae]|uniref:Bifunctional purine biosynthesis protein PurH n=1 Tax=Longilinea arvoryzae TaxID=360412 RepID=A0A0S7BDT9_9CHLR|nr:bifunctional phosphoribosylaminoimidazolecarboxamide formyltransferase/IMP cyclohydrolase [Longilinea arvoryzae]GAP12948.1 IMP cyclohydrolase [Longilinea arvoryzae]
MPKAILSVHDKTGLVEFARGLAGLGWELLASGGTARLLRENGLTVTEVAEYTGSPEVLGGRVKTLHPAVHAGLLARATDADAADLKANGWDYIDLVAVNLYPFEATIAKPDVTLADAIENIDIGGVTLIRAAAKNHERVTLICDPADYPAVLGALKNGAIPAELRAKLALKGFQHTAHYDAAIAGYLSNGAYEALELYPVQKLRYGENPHQSADLLAYHPGGGPLGGRVLQGKEVSYNNLLDLDAAWRAAVSFERPNITIVKHLSPCGIASADQLAEAFTAALASDPVSAYGGVIAANRAVDGAAAAEMAKLFVECIAAPGFEPAALEIFAKKKNLRLVEMPDLKIEPQFELRSINCGVLRQAVDFGDPAGGEWKVASKRAPTPGELKALHFAWKACQYVKSNAIVFAVGEATVGIGGGQPNRVDCVRIAAQRAGERSKGAVMASDAFFPFPDSVEIAAQAGITAIVHPGGSIRDAEAIAAADAAGMAMLFTGVRHFRH